MLLSSICFCIKIQFLPKSVLRCWGYVQTKWLSSNQLAKKASFHKVGEVFTCVFYVQIQTIFASGAAAAPPDPRPRFRNSETPQVGRGDRPPPPALENPHANIDAGYRRTKRIVVTLNIMTISLYILPLALGLGL